MNIMCHIKYMYSQSEVVTFLCFEYFSINYIIIKQINPDNVTFIFLLRNN